MGPWFNASSERQHLLRYVRAQHYTAPQCQPQCAYGPEIRPKEAQLNQDRHLALPLVC